MREPFLPGHHMKPGPHFNDKSLSELVPSSVKTHDAFETCYKTPATAMVSQGTLHVSSRVD